MPVTILDTTRRPSSFLLRSTNSVLGHLVKFGDAQLAYPFLHDYSLAHRWLELTCEGELQHGRCTTCARRPYTCVYCRRQRKPSCHELGRLGACAIHGKILAPSSCEQTAICLPHASYLLRWERRYSRYQLLLS